MNIDATGALGHASSPVGGPPGQVLAGRYRLAAQLGRGSASTVYLGHDMHVGGRPVALKIATGSHDTSKTAANREHLLNEARALAAIHHPAVIQLADVLVQGPRCALVLEYLPGRTMRDIVGNAPAAEQDVLEWGMRLCDVLAHLQAQQPGLAHGALHAGHCMILPTGRLVLFDFGSIIPASEATLRQDIRTLLVLLYRLLAGLDAQPASDEMYPPVRAYAQYVSVATDKLLHSALNGSLSSSLTWGMLRHHLLRCSQTLGVTWDICPYCQANIRTRTEYCGSCGSTLEMDSVQHATATVDAKPAPSPARRPTLDVPRPLGKPRHMRHTPMSYAQKLRAVGRYIERQQLRRVTIVDSPDGVFIRGQTDGVGQLGDGAIGSTIAVLVSEDELTELSVQGYQLRSPQDRRPAQRKGSGLLGSPLFTKGYENQLRALGAQLDSLAGVTFLTIVETATELVLDHEIADSATSTSVRHRHELLTASDLETILTISVARRNRGERVQPLRAMIERSQQI